MANKKTKVLVVGGGFGGIKAALELAESDIFSVSLLSDKENFRYYPTLYRSATGGRMAASSIPLSEIFKNREVKLINDTADKLDREKNAIVGSSGKSYGFDKLIISLGVVTNYFGIKGLQEYSYGIKSQEEAQKLRDHIHKHLMDEGKPDLNYIVIGGGPTGVELAGALPAYINHVMTKHGIKRKALHIDLVEAAPRLMPRMPRDYSRAVAARLRRLDVKLYLNEKVEAETAGALMVSGHSLESHTVIWTAGVINHPFFAKNKFMLSEHGKVKVDGYLQAEPGIYVIGDNADTPFSGMAQTAIYDAKYIAKLLRREAEGKKLRPYKPHTPVYVTPVGPGWAAVIWNKVHLYGKAGWVTRSAADLAGFHDYEPWKEASRHWIAEYLDEKTCSVCAQ